MESMIPFYAEVLLVSSWPIGRDVLGSWEIEEKGLRLR
jgi:hypothetical protein